MKYGEQTPYKLFKPDYEDHVLVDDLNHNTEITDKQFSKIDSALDSKAPIKDPTFRGTVVAPNPGGLGDEDKSEVTTTDYVEASLHVYEILSYNTRNDLPETGTKGYVYLLQGEENNPELIWNGAEYIERN